MAQDPLHVLWVEPHFPGRLGPVADWLVRRRGYRCWFYCHSADPRDSWPDSVGNGLELQTFGVGGVAREPAVPWSRTLERSLCYAYGCWEVLEARRPRPIDLIVGRSAGLGSTLFAPVYAPAPPQISLFDYYVHPRSNDLADDDAAGAAPAYAYWRRSANVCDLLELEQCDLAWTHSDWQRRLYPSEYQDDFWIQFDGIAMRRLPERARRDRRVIAGRTVPDGTRVVSFVARSLDRLRGFDRFWHLANDLLLADRDLVCVIIGDPVVQRGLDVHHHNRDYVSHLATSSPPVDPERLWLLGKAPASVVSQVLAASDLHVAPGRPYPVSRSLLEAMGAGCVVLASDTAPHREVIRHGQSGLLGSAEDHEDMVRLARSVLDDPAGNRPLGEAAAERVRDGYDREVCLPLLAEKFSSLAAASRR